MKYYELTTIRRIMTDIKYTKQDIEELNYYPTLNNDGMPAAKGGFSSSTEANAIKLEKLRNKLTSYQLELDSARLDLMDFMRGIKDPKLLYYLKAVIYEGISPKEAAKATGMKRHEMDELEEYFFINIADYLERTI